MKIRYIGQSLHHLVAPELLEDVKRDLIANEHQIKGTFYGTSNPDLKIGAIQAARRHNAYVADWGLAGRWLIVLPGMV